ncbi:hypothetical protein DLJ59_15120 [Micromonospora inaquosa]|uniref:Uncharacterized protein n=1 Tax=Micromonospora inaquosa TaxID=2203716 RepID=A0A3N9X7Y6_9ACTN|nr:hypothetical protein DLJ59_15120 [Micromonospora inaquosa]
MTVAGGLSPLDIPHPVTGDAAPMTTARHTTLGNLSQCRSRLMSTSTLEAFFLTDVGTVSAFCQ